MKKYLVIMAAVAAALLAVCCNKEQNTPDEPKQTVAGEQITITASIPAELSKVGLAYTGTALHPTWAAGDKIRVADHDNASNYQDFTLTAGEGTQNGTFSGTAVSATSYDISIVNATSWPANVLAQTQAEDESTAHLGYTVALTGVNTYADIAFTSAWATSKGGTIAQSGALHLKVTLPDGVAAKVNNVTMVADKNIFGSTGTMSIAITTPGDNGTANTLDVYASIPPTGVTIPASTGLLFKFGTNDADHSVYTRYYQTSGALNLAGGQLNLISLTGTNTDKYAGKNDDGTAAHPYLIADKYQLQAANSLLSSGVTKYFKLVDDIDVAGFAWTALNNADPYDCPVNFDGNGKTISNLSAPLFYDLNGTVRDLTLAGASITVNKNGGILARTIVNAGTVSNIRIMDSEMITDNAEGAGGAIGKISNNAEIENVHVSNSTVQSKTIYCGGIVGWVQLAADATVSITRCSFEGSSVKATTYHAGGLVGCNNSTAGTLSVSNSYAKGSVTASRWAGGILGSHIAASTSTLTNCYSTSSVTTSWGSGGVVGYITQAGVNAVRCMAYNNSISATVGAGNRYSSGAIVGYGKNVDVEVNYCFRSDGVTFSSNATDNTALSDMAFISPAGKIPQSGSTNPYAYCHHGQETTSTLSTLVQDASKVGVAWSSTVWDFSTDFPTLK